MRGLDVARILLFFSFVFDGKIYPCALIRWYPLISEERDEDTGMWMVEPDTTDDGSPFLAIVHIDCIFRAAHLLPFFGEDFVPKTLTLHDSLNFFRKFYVNKFIDHHAFEIAS